MEWLAGMLFCALLFIRNYGSELIGANYLPNLNQCDIKGHKVQYELSDKWLI